MRKTRVMLTLSAVGGVSIVAGAYAVYAIVSGPSVGTLSSTPSKTDSPQSVQERNIIDGQYARYSVLDGFVKTVNEKPSGNEVELSSFVRQRTTGSWNVVVRIVRLDGQSLQQEGTFNFRRTASDRFSMTEQLIGNQEMIIFTDGQDSSFNKIAYLTNDDLVASVFLSGGMPNNFGRLESEFRDLLTSWRWK